MTCEWAIGSLKKYVVHVVLLLKRIIKLPLVSYLTWSMRLLDPVIIRNGTLAEL